MQEWITTSTVLRDLRDFDNRSAWDRFVQRFRPPVVAFARSMGLTANDSDDVAQETMAAFAQAYREGHYQRERGRLSQWLLGIAYRKALDQRRKSARTGAREIGGDALFAEKPDLELTATWDREWEQALLEQCLRQVQQEVEPVTFAAFELVVRDSCDAAAAAERLGVGIKVVYNAKHRVLKRIRELRSELEEVA